MAKDWCASCQNNSKDYDDIICVMCVWQEEDNDNLPPTNYIYKPQTNADRIRAMTDEELAEWITELTDYAVYPHTRKDAPCVSIGQTCAASWLDWLKQEANDAT